MLKMILIRIVKCSFEISHSFEFSLKMTEFNELRQSRKVGFFMYLLLDQ